MGRRTQTGIVRKAIGYPCENLVLLYSLSKVLMHIDSHCALALVSATSPSPSRRVALCRVTFDHQRMVISVLLLDSILGVSSQESIPEPSRLLVLRSSLERIATSPCKPVQSLWPSQSLRPRTDLRNHCKSGKSVPQGCGELSDDQLVSSHELAFPKELAVIARRLASWSFCDVQIVGSCTKAAPQDHLPSQTVFLP